MKEKVLFLRAYYGINIHSDAQGEFGEQLNTRDVFPDFPLLTAATIFKESGEYDVTVIDAVLEDKLLPDELLKRLEKEAYDRVILKASAPTIRSDIELLKAIKNIMPEARIMIAGHTAKVLKDWIEKNVKEIDDVIEKPIDEFAYRLFHKTEGDIVVNDIPTPDYTLVNYKKYTDDSNRVRLTIQASRGCPMGCTYCPYKIYYEKFGYRDVDRVMEDIHKLLDLGAEVIQFRDQYFTADKERIKELCNRIIEEKLEFDWICETRLDSLDEELVDLLKKAGVFLICFGVESGEEELLSIYNSVKGSPEKLKNIIEYINKTGIITMAFYIVGFPEENWKMVEGTYKFAEYLSSSYGIFNEYRDFHLGGTGNDISPEAFEVFGNSINVHHESVLSKEERKYLVRLYSILYTMRSSYETAYLYNYKLIMDNKRAISKMIPYACDLKKLSECVRQMWESGEHEK